MKTINDLTEKCLIYLFGQFSLAEMAELIKVCKLWKKVIKKICSQKKSFKLFSSLQNVRLYSEQMALFNLQGDTEFVFRKHLKGDIMIGGTESCSKLYGMFANLQTLCSDWSSVLERKLCAFKNLNTLTLHGPGDKNLDSIHFLDVTKTTLHYNTQQFDRVLRQLDSLESLKNLHLIGVSSIRKYQLPTIAILANLESFSLCYYFGNCLPTLRKLGPGLKQLTLKHLNISYRHFEEFIKKKKPKWRTSLTQLRVDSVFQLPLNLIDPSNIFCEIDDSDANKKRKVIEEKILFDFICKKFPALECFEFNFDAMFKHEKVVSSLELLPNLSELYLRGVWDFDSKRQLKSIKIVNLILLDLLYDFPKINFQTIFPNLETIRIIGDVYHLGRAKKYSNKYGWTCAIEYTKVKSMPFHTEIRKIKDFSERDPTDWESERDYELLNCQDYSDSDSSQE